MNWPLSLPVKIFAEESDPASMIELARYPWMKGFITDPVRLRQAGVRDYESFARDIIRWIPDRPICLEVLASEFEEMAGEARRMASWGENVYVKIPVTNARGESATDLLRGLAREGSKLNATAVMTLPQVRSAVTALAEARSAFISVSAGGIADTGRDPAPILSAGMDMLRPHKRLELIWAGPREMLNVMQAGRIGCHAICLTPELLEKLPLLGKNLMAHSLDLVRETLSEAAKSGIALESAGIHNLARELAYEPAALEQPAAR